MAPQLGRAQGLPVCPPSRAVEPAGSFGQPLAATTSLLWLGCLQPLTAVPTTSLRLCPQGDVALALPVPVVPDAPLAARLLQRNTAPSQGRPEALFQPHLCYHLWVLFLGFFSPA